MTRPRHLRTARHGFTLVELMVATALVVLILTILAVAFGAASDSLSRLRSTGNMATQLRTTQDRFRSDVEAQHFEPGDSPGPLRLADLRYDLFGTVNVKAPTDGYFRIESGTGSIYEGQDAETLLSTRANTHAIEFTSKLQGRTPDDLFVVPFTAPNNPLAALSASDTPLAANLFATKWARIRWQLGNPQTVSGGGGPVQVWTLYRDVRAIAPPNGGGLALTKLPDDANVLAVNAANQTVTLAQLTNPANRTQPLAPFAAGNPSFGDDIVLTNVTSFEIKPCWDTSAGVRGPRQTLPVANNAFGTAIPDSPAAPPGPTANSDLPFDDLPAAGGQRTFDTWNDATTAPLRIRVTALQVKIRVFDPKTLLSRQVSFIVQP